MAEPRSFGVLILASLPAGELTRLAGRIHRQVTEARLCGLLYEMPPRKSLGSRGAAFLQNLREWAFVTYAAGRVFGLLARAVGRWGGLLLRAAHGWPPRSPDPGAVSLGRFCQELGCPLLVTADMHSTEALEFVRRLAPDLGITYGCRTPEPRLFSLPRLGMINLHKRKLPDYRGYGPVGLWELLNDERELGVTVHRVDGGLDTGAVIAAATLPIGPFDTLTSLALKAGVVGNDLLVQAVADFARGRAREVPQQGAARLFEAPRPRHLGRWKKAAAVRRPAYRCRPGRPWWKLLLRIILLGPAVVARNWVRRLRGRFPVIILYHHVVTDRAHYMGIPTELFLNQVEFLRRHYRIVSLREAIETLAAGRVSAPLVVLTFDDGYQENFLNLRAVIEQTGIPVSFFVCTELVGAQRGFDHDARKGERGFLPFTWEQLAFLERGGCEIGSHTRTHFDCGSMDLEALRSEIVGSKADLESCLGHAVKFFSFPWGKPDNMSAPAVELARTTYPYVLSTVGGENHPNSAGQPWHLRRCPHPNHLWELELTLQSILDF